MKILLLVIAVTNGRVYHEEPMYVVQYTTEVACQAAAAKYPTRGFEYQRAVCLPKVENK